MSAIIIHDRVNFEVGICDCCAAPGGAERCCLVAWCPCIAIGRLAASKKYPPPPGLFPGVGDCCQACVLNCIVQSIPWIGQTLEVWLFSYPIRKASRPRGMDWDGCSECCTVVCCSRCALCQELNSLERRGGQSWNANYDYIAPSLKEMQS